MSETMLYYFASTIAQSVVALLAFGSFVAIWRRDAIWGAVEPQLNGLARTIDRLQVYVQEAGESERPEQSRPMIEEYWSATAPDGRLDTIARAVGVWIEGQDLPEGKARSKHAIIARDGPPVVEAHRIRSEILIWLNQLIRAGLVSFVVSLIAIWLAGSFVESPGADLAFVLLAVGGIWTALAAGRLSYVCLQETGG